VNVRSNSALTVTAVHYGEWAAQLIRDYLEPRLGGVPLQDLTIAKTQAMFTALLRANAKRAHPLAPATFQRIREVLRVALNGAIRRGVITRNPARWVTHGDVMHWSPSYVSHTFRRLIHEADLPPVRFHDLRRGAASLSLAAGNDPEDRAGVARAREHRAHRRHLHQRAALRGPPGGRDHRWQRPPGHTRPKKGRTTAEESSVLWRLPGLPVATPSGSQIVDIAKYAARDSNPEPAG
jgi:hypothetical protein